LYNLFESRESLKIQAQSAVAAQKRVNSSNPRLLLAGAGRTQKRDLLKAQELLVLVQNSLTSAVISYRIAKLELQPDMGLLQVDESGLW
jgi:hypothetical protein